jgi:hypothetical protein
MHSTLDDSIILIMCLDDAQVKALSQLPLKASSVDKHVADLTDGIVMWYARVNYY